MTTINEKDIQSFWRWFSESRNKLESHSYDPAILNQLDQKVATDWNLNWEIGPGKAKENSLTISPKGDIKLLQLTEFIVSKAPAFEDWEFYATKQPKENWHLLELKEEGISVNASEWQYVLLKYENEKIEVFVKAVDLHGFHYDIKELIIEIVLINLLGEDLFIRKVNYFDIVDSFDSEKGITAIKHLPQHLLK